MSANELLSNLHTILKAASFKCNVIEEKFPIEFFESDPEKIYESYVAFIQGQIGPDGTTIKNEESMMLTTITEKFENNEYKAESNGFYTLYHDIKLVCTMLIQYYSPGTRNYQLVDKFYRFATELILRECYKIGIQISNIKGLDEDDIKAEEQAEDRTDELNDAISQDFIKISTYYKIPTSETYHIKTKDLDLFSSIISKSVLDHRPKELPNSNFDVNKIIPQSNLFEAAPKLGFLAANISNIPDPTLPPTEMMTHFLHPNWYALPTTTWLKYGDYSSWAPSFNENGTVLDSTTRGIIWLKRIGYTEMVKGDDEKVMSETEEKADDTIIDKDEEDADDKAIYIETETEEKETKPTEKLPIKAENVVEWSPENYISDDEIESFKNGTQDKLVNSILLKLNKLRKERVMNKVTKPSNHESKLYYKVKRLMKEVLLNGQVSSVPLNHVKGMPVLQANYNGSIPVIRSHPGRKRKHKK